MDKSALLEAIYASATDFAIVTMDENGVITSWNNGASRIFGYQASDVIGRSGELIFTPEDRAHGVPLHEYNNARMLGRAADNRWHLRSNGTRFWADGVMTPIKNPGGSIAGFLKILRDQTDKRSAELEALRCANHDSLTGLSNRYAFEVRCAEMLAAVQRGGQAFVVQLIDLDHFKNVNDTFGHDIGDMLLQQAVQRIREVTRDTDFIARLGGDEFVILQPDAHSPEVGGVLADKLVETLARPFKIDGKEILSGASIGIAMCPQDARQADDLLKKADLALYKVKNGGRNGYHYFTEEIDAEAHKKTRDLAELRSAVKEHAFWLAYHPQFDSRSQQVIGVEVLLRCSNPLLANYPTNALVALAAETGLMPEIGAWVFSKACAQTKLWRTAGLAGIKICINICARELIDPRTPANISAALDDAGLGFGDMEIEIAEQYVYDTGDQGAAILAELRARGISVAIDDFGTGYSCLGNLSALPIDKLKLNQSFVQNIPRDPKSCELARIIIRLAHTLNLALAVEGVESQEQANFFRAEHCDVLQGYHFGRPLAAEPMTAWLIEQAQMGKVSTISAA